MPESKPDDIAEKLVPCRVLSKSDKMRMCLLVRKSIIEAIDPEVMIPFIARKFNIDEEQVTTYFNTISQYTREQLAERAKLLKGDRHFQRGLLLKRLEKLFRKAYQGGDLKVALACLKEQRELLDLSMKRANRAESKSSATPVPMKRLAQMSDEELREAAKGHNLGN